RVTTAISRAFGRCMAGPGRNGANDAMLIREVQADHYYIPLAAALSDSTHGTIRGFEVVTVRLRDTEGAEGVGYTYTVGRVAPPSTRWWRAIWPPGSSVGRPSTSRRC